MADAFGLSDAAIVNYTKGRRNPDAPSCLKIAEATGAPVEEVLAMAASQQLLMSEPPTNIRDLLWEAYRREGFRTNAAMARAYDIEPSKLWRWMSDRGVRRNPSSSKSLAAVARIVKMPETELLRLSLADSAAARGDTSVQRTTGASTTKRMDHLTTLLSALVQRHGSIDKAEQDLGVPEGTLLGLLDIRLELMTVKGLRTVAQDIGISFSDLVRHVEQGGDE